MLNNFKLNNPNTYSKIIFFAFKHLKSMICAHYVYIQLLDIDMLIDLYMFDRAGPSTMLCFRIFKTMGLDDTYMHPVNLVSIDSNIDFALVVTEIGWNVIYMSVLLKLRHVTKLKYMYFKYI